MPSTPTVPGPNGTLITEQQDYHLRLKSGGDKRGHNSERGRIRYRGRHSRALKCLIEHLKGVCGRDLVPSEKAACIVLCTPWAREERSERSGR